MKNSTIILATGLFSGMLLSSCSNFLTEDPKGTMAPEAFYTSQNDLDMAVHSLYYNVQLSMHNSNPFIVQCQGDDMTSTTGSNKASYLAADAFEVPADFKGQNDLWKGQYNIIQAANQIIDNADRCNTTTENINIAVGNARFWRAIAYFQLVRVFGPLPVNLHNAADNNNTPLTPESEIYNMILEDVLEAEKCNLPATYEGRDYGNIDGLNYWVTDQAVKSLLTALYMQMAGWPLNLGNEYYALAADKAKEVVDGVKSGKYPQALESDWQQVYSYGNNFSKEIILPVVFKGVPYQMNDWTTQFPLCHRFTQGGWADFIPEFLYWAQFPEGPRKECVYDPMINTYLKDDDGNYLCVDWWATENEQPIEEDKSRSGYAYSPMFSPFSVNQGDDGEPIAAPYRYDLIGYSGQSCDKVHRMIRYSEVLCWFAEASARSGKYSSEALSALKEVQDRAYAADVVPDNSDLAEAAYREHGYEVAGYPLALVTRRADQMRMDRLKEAWEYRHGKQEEIIVPKGTVTHSFKRTKVTDPVTHRPTYTNAPYTYELSYDLIIRQPMDVSETWEGINSIYQAYPPNETEKNPNIKR